MSNENDSGLFGGGMSDEFKDLDNFVAEESLLQQLKRYRAPKNEESSESINETVYPAVMESSESTSVSESSSIGKTSRVVFKDVPDSVEIPVKKPSLDDIPLVKTDLGKILGAKKRSWFWPAPGFTNLLLLVGIIAAGLYDLTALLVVGFVVSISVTVLQMPFWSNRIASALLALAYGLVLALIIF